MSTFAEVRLDRLFDEVNDLVPAERLTLLTPSVVRGVVPQSSLDSRPQQALREGYCLNRAQPNDFVISMSSHAHGIEFCGLEGGISPDYTVLRPKFNADLIRFMAYALKSKPVIYQLGAFKTGIRMGLRLTWNKVKYCKIEVPSPDYAVLAADYLDRETSQIDDLIDKKTKFISLLNERAIESVVACTRPRRAWNNYPFWSITNAKSITGRSEEELLSVYLDRGVIPYSEGGGLVHKPAESLEKYQLVERGDLVMNNQQAWRGSLGVSTHRGIVSPAYLIFELDREQIDPAFANYAFRSRPYVDQFMLASMSVGDIQRQIKWPHLRRVMVSLPSLSDQKRIVDELDKRLSRLEGLIARTRKSVTYLQEKRTALITAAVTGKIDVRNAA